LHRKGAARCPVRLKRLSMDLQEVARQFGGHVAFCGGISDQSLDRLTPAQVKEHVRRAIATLGKDFKNAYIVAPSNIIPPEISPANLQALFEACHMQ
jgi:uroporphyrinogen-III decarboxylase